MIDSDDPRLRRLSVRSWRRGTKEMDLILGRWSDAHLAELSEGDLDAFEALLAENDPELYDWITGRSPTPDAHRALIHKIAQFSKASGPV